MSNYIVLVKQVPDVSQITDNAFNPETGTLVRTRLANVINELDTHALAVAERMKKNSGDKNAKIIALTMGPPMAEDVLRYSLGRCADAAVLLTDKALGGADTWATANPLAFSIRKIVKEIFNGSQNYFVVCGMQSVDGDTAQVPAQIAEELNLPCIAYVTDVEYKAGKFEFRKIISGGSQTISPKKTPAVITVAKYEYPLFAGFAASRRASKMQLIQWGAADINATAVGVKGSKTRVIRVFPPGKTTRKCLHVNSVEELAKLICENYRADETAAKTAANNGRYILPAKRKGKFDRHFEGTEKETADYKLLADQLEKMGIDDISKIDDTAKDKIITAVGGSFHKKALDDMLEGLKNYQPAYHGEVWVAAEQSGEVIHSATYELIGKARELADSLETHVGVALIGSKVERFTKSLISAGADKIYMVDHPLLAEFDPVPYRKALGAMIEKYWPQIVLFAATPQGRTFAPMVSYRLGCGLTADCTGLDIKDSSRKGEIAILMQTRPALGGNVMATIVTKDSKSQMATARPGVMKRLPDDPHRKGQIIKETVNLTSADLSIDIIKTEMGTGKVNFNAEIIVTGGKGMQNRDNYEELVGMLQATLSGKFGTPVERGASRAAVEQGFIDRVHQVGQTGTAVGPKIYFALGVSGAIQHMIGVSNSRTIIAINSDHNAPIFKQCDYYMTGTCEDIIPQLCQAIQKA